MNVFILNTGRCGSTTFIKACKHIENYSCAHESKVSEMGHERLNFSENHIEADNRLSWFLGRLDEKFGNDAFYVHLKRDDAETAKSYSTRLFSGGIIPAYINGIIFGRNSQVSGLSVGLDYCNTVNSNISLFLKDKDKKMDISLEHIKEDFVRFWEAIGAQGNLKAALAEFDVKYNATSVQHLTQD